MVTRTLNHSKGKVETSMYASRVCVVSLQILQTVQDDQPPCQAGITLDVARQRVINTAELGDQQVEEKT